MKLTIQKYSQNDDRWRTDGLNNTSSTIGDFGCYMTCLAMFLKFRGYSVTPKTLNEKLTTNLCYKGDLIDAPKIAQLYKGSFNGIEQFDTKPAPLDRVKALIDQGTPVIVEIDARPSVAGKQTHFVLIVGYEDDSIIINDPWDGVECVLEQRYKNSEPASAASTITGLRIFDFSKVEVAEENTELTRIIQFLKENNALSEGKVREAFGALTEKPNLQTSIDNLIKENTQLKTNQEENIKIVDDLRKKIGELSLLNSQIQDLATGWQSKCSTANDLLTEKSLELDEEKKLTLELNDKIAKLISENSKEMTIGRFITLLINKFQGLIPKKK